MNTNSARLNIAIVAFDRPLTLKNLLSQINEFNAKTVSFFFDFPPSQYYNNNKYEECLFIARHWASEIPLKVFFFLAESHMGGNRNTLRAMDYLSKEFGEGLLCEDDADIHPSYFEFLNTLNQTKSDELRASYIYGITPFLGVRSRDLKNISNPRVSLQLNSLMGGTLGLYMSSQLIDDFYITLRNLGRTSEFAKLLSAVSSMPVSKSLKASFAFAVTGKYNRYVELWAEEIPPSSPGIPSWDGLLMCSILIRGRHIHTPNFSLVREFHMAQREGSWHPKEPESEMDWRAVPKQIEITISQNSIILSEVVKDQLIFHTKSKCDSSTQRLQGFLLLTFPKQLGKYLFKVFRCIASRLAR